MATAQLVGESPSTQPWLVTQTPTEPDLIQPGEMPPDAPWEGRVRGLKVTGFVTFFLMFNARAPRLLGLVPYSREHRLQERPQNTKTDMRPHREALQAGCRDSILVGSMEHKRPHKQLPSDPEVKPEPLSMVCAVPRVWGPGTPLLHEASLSLPKSRNDLPSPCGSAELSPALGSTRYGGDKTVGGASPQQGLSYRRLQQRTQDTYSGLFQRGRPTQGCDGRDPADGKEQPNRSTLGKKQAKVKQEEHMGEIRRKESRKDEMRSSAEKPNPQVLVELKRCRKDKHVKD
ncbi:hypothetical protein E5288_WYG007766 [Bos mutus]|uniref:Uncharacterized protein n=1 Tax=Bos mutus TaxID=72004 RepID=A0A6B0RAU7_9CETA|nr:hypothetical protein [Bos mutus]